VKTYTATTNITHGPKGRIVPPGEELILTEDEAAPLVESGAVQVIERTPHELASLGSAELRRRLGAIDKRLEQAREKYADYGKLRDAAVRELKDPPRPRRTWRGRAERAREGGNAQQRARALPEGGRGSA
jgi:hypothetical protein